jgi:hypothetical protein
MNSHQAGRWEGPPQELMRDGANCPSVWLPDLTMDGGIRATCNLAEEGKKGSMVDRGRPAKNAEMRAETLRSEEGSKEKSEF